MRWSYKRPTALICSINAFLVIYVLYGLLVIRRNFQRPNNISVAHLGALPSPNVTQLHMRYTWEERVRLVEAEEARRAMEALELMKRVKELQLESMGDALKDKDLSGSGAKQKVVEVLALPLRGTINESSSQENVTESKDPGLGSSLEPVHASLLPVKPHNKLEGGKLVLDGPEIEDGIIPGRPVPEICNAEPHTDYDGLAVTWGLTHHKESAADCCQACLDQARNAKNGEMKCNVWVYCPAEEGCFSPDIYEHKQFECWLKQTEVPRINFKGRYSPEYQRDHPNCPQVVAWASGVISPT